MRKNYYSILTLFCLLLFSNSSFSQKEYYSIDSILVIGKKMIDGGPKVNSKWCQVKNGNNIVKYSPNEVKEYGLKDGRVYISKEILVSGKKEKVFLERIEEGKTSLYFYKDNSIKTFYVEADSNSLVPLPKSDDSNVQYTEKLLTIFSDCENIKGAAKLASYKKASLKKLLQHYNSCESKAFPFTKYGIICGYSGIKLASTATNDEINFSSFNYEYNNNFIVGLFVEKPIYMSYLSFRSEIYFSKYGYTDNFKNTDSDMDLLVNISSVNLPLMIKYSSSSIKLRPYITAGGTFTYNYKNENAIYKATVNQNIIEINDINTEKFISDYYAGYLIGGGIEYNLDYKHSLFFELRINNNFGLSESKTLKMKGFNLLTGINF